MPERFIQMNLSEGLNTAKPEETLDRDELVWAEGIYYPNGRDGIPHVAPGRIAWKGVAPNTKVKGLTYVAQDYGDDYIVAYALSGYFVGDPATQDLMIFAEEVSPSGTAMIASHYNDAFFICNGVDYNRVFISGQFRLHGMRQPFNFGQESLEVSYPGSTVRPVSHEISGEWPSIWQAPEYAYDTSPSSGLYARGLPELPGTTSLLISGWASRTSISGTYFKVDYSTLFESAKAGDIGRDPDGSGPRDPARGTWAFYLSYNGGLNWSGIKSGSLLNPVDRTTLLVPIESGINVSGVKFRADIVVIREFDETYAEVRIFDAVIQGFEGYGASGVAPFTTSSGLYYGVTEYDANGKPAKLESVPWVVPQAITLNEIRGENAVVINLPSTPVNPNTTHYRIYRTTDGGLVPEDLGLIGEVPVGQPYFVDTFEQADKDTPAVPKIDTIFVEDAATQTGVYYYLNERPKPWSHVNAYQGSLVGIDAEDTRRLWYTVPGRPDASPSIYRIDSFAMPEHDRLVGTATLGDSLIVLGEEGLFEMRGLPIVTGGALQFSPPTRIVGVPGCVGPGAFASISDQTGYQWVVWVSPFGIYKTDGTRSYRISESMDWPVDVETNQDMSGYLLFWHKQEGILWFGCKSARRGSGTENDTVYLFHMYENSKRNLPKITGPHERRVTQLGAGKSGSEYSVFSSSANDGIIYREWYPFVYENSIGTWVSGVVNPDSLPMIIDIKTPKIYNDSLYEEYKVNDLRVRHSIFRGPTQGREVWLSFTSSFGNDHDDYTGTRVVSGINLNEQKVHTIPVERQQEWFQYQFYVSGVMSQTWEPYIINFRATAEGGGNAGEKY